MKKTLVFATVAVLSASCLLPAEAALTVSRSRVIVNEGDKSVSMSVTNRNTQEPYLAQTWIEDEAETKVTSPLMVLPPVQRIEAGAKSAVRVQVLPDVSKLPKDRESVFWFNLREIPPRSDKPNVLTLALQTRLKIFWRPASIKVDAKSESFPGIQNVTLAKNGNNYTLNNPTPYHLTFVEGRSAVKGKGKEGFEPVMVAPKAQATLNVGASDLGATPVLVFVNDYGSLRLLPFQCTGFVCKALPVITPES
ncbi:fimbria/pilus periplasmic chaperone [Klebsiella oxytoca]|uniref:fimbria/pilus periplasmic chaperone n=1 Tax=Klebsiella TaxID=570 RepID=UPI001908D4ED|nr:MULTISPECIES: fimbria/pilus periplasmic chaperone [Klebsiella]MBK0162790.1 fimbria/pilus periplasmic chaperone [Klebsiella sp. S69]MEB7876682.1 fimbria/pilus periplasmic chaperone [Klebsiella oxytoca]